MNPHGLFLSRSARDAQHLFTLKLGERGCSLAMPGLGLPKRLRERWFPAERVEPRIVGHGWKTDEAALDDSFKKLECGLDLLEMREMSREIEEAFGISEVRGHNPIDRGDALRSVAFQQGPRGHHEIAHPRPCGLLELSKAGDGFLLTTDAPSESATM